MEIKVATFTRHLLQNLVKTFPSLIRYSPSELSANKHTNIPLLFPPKNSLPSTMTSTYPNYTVSKSRGWLCETILFNNLLSPYPHTQNPVCRNNWETKRVTQRNALPSGDWNHPVMISDINVSATFSITVTEDYYSQLSSVMWIRELMKVLRLPAINVAERVSVEQQKGWVFCVTVSVAYICYSRRWKSCNESLEIGTKWYT